MEITEETKKIIIKFTKSYNLCDEKDYNELATDLQPYLKPFTDYNNEYDYYYINWWLHITNMNGPAIKPKNSTPQFFLDNVELTEEQFHNHEDIKKRKYLKEHPETKAFL